jgi:hypothetical protein
MVPFQTRRAKDGRPRPKLPGPRLRAQVAAAVHATKRRSVIVHRPRRSR